MSFNKSQEIFTYVLNGSTLTITQDYGLTAVALLLKSGSGAYSGSRTIGGIASTPIPLGINIPLTITSEQSKYIDELLIDGSGGVIEIIGR